MPALTILDRLVYLNKKITDCQACLRTFRKNKLVPITEVCRVSNVLSDAIREREFIESNIVCQKT